MIRRRGTGRRGLRLQKGPQRVTRALRQPRRSTKRSNIVPACGRFRSSSWYLTAPAGSGDCCAKATP